MERFLIYKKNNKIDKSQGFIHESCFPKGKTDSEIITQFYKTEFEVEIVNTNQLQELLSSLEDSKLSKINKMKLLKDNELLKPIPQTIGTLSNKTFNIKANDIFLFGNIIDMLEVSGGTRDWTDANGDRLSLNVDDYKGLRNHLLVRDETVYNLYSQKKAAIEACQTLEQLEQININFL